VLRCHPPGKARQHVDLPAPLRLGYNRAAYVIDYSRNRRPRSGEGAKPREILVDLESYQLNF